MEEEDVSMETGFLVVFHIVGLGEVFSPGLHAAERHSEENSTAPVGGKFVNASSLPPCSSPLLHFYLLPSSSASSNSMDKV